MTHEAESANCDTMGRFWSKVSIDRDTECWNWTAGKSEDGYGKFSYQRKNVRAHRFSWECFVGTIPPNICVCHRCDNRACVNPSHLFLGTNKENMMDRDRKGRHVACKGTKHGRAKLTEDQVRAIREDPRTQQVIAEEYGVNQTAVGNIKRRERWGHLK